MCYSRKRRCHPWKSIPQLTDPTERTQQATWNTPVDRRPRSRQRTLEARPEVGGLLCVILDIIIYAILDYTEVNDPSNK